MGLGVGRAGDEFAPGAIALDGGLPTAVAEQEPPTRNSVRTELFLANSRYSFRC
jgi:hypothetical protein